MKRKLFSLALALVLCLSLAVPAFAEEDLYDRFTPAEEGADIFRTAAAESGVIYEAQDIDLQFIGFARSGSNGEHIIYNTYENYEDGAANLVPEGMDIVISGAKSADEVILHAFSTADMEEGFFEVYEDPSSDVLTPLSEGTYLFYRLFVRESGKDLSLAPLDMDDPLNFDYEDPKDGETYVAGHVTAADAGFQVNEDGNVVLDSQRLYELFSEGDFLRITVGEYFWVYRLSGEPSLVSDIFTDIEAGKWPADAVSWAWTNDITTGKSENRFAPGDSCTQAQILTFLYRAAREEQVASSAEDTELAIEWAREKGMIDDSFDGSVPCTRSTAVNYIWQAFDKPSAEVSTFTDVEADADYAAAVSWAVEKGITNGTNAEGTVFSPDEVCTRGHIVTFLYRAYTN